MSAAGWIFTQPSFCPPDDCFFFEWKACGFSSWLLDLRLKQIDRRQNPITERAENAGIPDLHVRLPGDLSRPIAHLFRRESQPSRAAPLREQSQAVDSQAGRQRYIERGSQFARIFNPLKVFDNIPARSASAFLSAVPQRSSVTH
jgi:hypothetical protein